MQQLARPLPSSIQVTACQRASVVSIDHAIRIEHWHDFEHVVLPENFGFLGVRIDQEVESPLHHPRPNRLSRVHSSSQNYSFALSHIILVLLRSDGEKVDLVAGKRLAERPALDELLFDGVCHDSVDVLEQLRKRVGVAVRKENVIVVIGKLVREGQRVQRLEHLLAFFPDSILVVGDFVAAAMPSDVFCLRLLLRVNKDLHAVVVKGVRLAQV